MCSGSLAVTGRRSRVLASVWFSAVLGILLIAECRLLTAGFVAARSVASLFLHFRQYLRGLSHRHGFSRSFWNLRLSGAGSGAQRQEHSAGKSFPPSFLPCFDREFSANGNGDPNGTKNTSVRASVREISAIGAD